MNKTLGRLLTVAFAVAVVSPTSADLTHRYSFTTDASDSAGAANGTLEGAARVEGGVVILDGTSGTYVNLPGGLLQNYTAVTIETWATVYPASAAWTRIFDFGAISGSNGRNYLFMTTQSGAGSTRVAISDADPGYNHEELLDVPGVKDDGVPFHIAVVWAPEVPLAVMYIDGVPVDYTAELTIPLSAIDPENCFIGRSLYAPDGYLNADIDEFRIHNTVLTTPEIAASVTAGPDNPSYDPGTATGLTLTLPAETTAGFTETPEVAVNFSIAGAVTLPPLEVNLSSSDTSVLDITGGGLVRAVGPGTATITAEYGGQSDTATLNVIPPDLPPAALVHRWSFNEVAGTYDFTDSVGGKLATAYVAAQGTNDVAVGNGQAEFFGGASYLDGAYIDFPDYTFSNRTNLTVEIWATWNGPTDSPWQRLYDFGSSGKVDDPHASGNGTGSFFLTPRAGNDRLRFDAAPLGFTGEQVLDGPARMPTGQEVHLVTIFAPDLRKSELWQDGVLAATGDAPFALLDLNDVNCWMGIANWNDPPLNGSVNEFRIYEGALNELEIALSRQAGPDTLSTPPGTLQGLSVTAPTLYIGNAAAAQAILLADFENISDLDIGGLNSSGFASSDPNIFTVTGSGALLPVGVGSATLTASYGGMQANTTVEVAAPSALSLTVSSPLPAGGPVTPVVATATFHGTDVDVTGFNGITYSSASESIATVSAAGGVLPLRVGNTTLTAEFAGQQATASLQVEMAAGHEAANLIHRYSFSEASGTTVVTDSVGTANGELINPSTTSDFTGSGRLMLSGGAWNGDPQGGYVNLPNGLVSSLTSLTIEAWVNWVGPGGSSWQRIFDFGRNAANDGSGNFVEDQFVNPGLSYMFLTPRSGGNTVRFAIKEGDAAERPVLDAPVLTVGEDSQVAVVYDTAAGAVRLYVNGQRVATGAVTYPLSVVEDLNVYLGRAQWTDPYFAGEFDEFRIYQGTKLDDEVLAAFNAGPDNLPQAAGPELTATVQGSQLVISWPADATGFALQTAGSVTADTWTEVNGVANNQVTVDMTEAAAYYRLSPQ